MRNTILLVFLILVFLSCDNKKTKDIESDTVKESTQVEPEIEDQKPEPVELQGEGKIRADINELYHTEVEKCSQSITAVTDFKGKKEFWRICESGDGNRIIQINWHEESNLYGEIYFEQGNKLVYAEESIMYMPINHYILQGWVCQFYADNGKLVSLMSLGHGKTETDDWDPEIIFDTYKNRMGELNKIAK